MFLSDHHAFLCQYHPTDTPPTLCNPSNWQSLNRTLHSLTLSLSLSLSLTSHLYFVAAICLFFSVCMLTLKTSRTEQPVYRLPASLQCQRSCRVIMAQKIKYFDCFHKNRVKMSNICMGQSPSSGTTIFFNQLRNTLSIRETKKIL
jgi:hypothetical protein